MAVTAWMPPEVLDPQRPQIIVCGLGRTGSRIFSLLRQQGAKVVGISYHPLPEVVGEVVVGELRSPTTLKAAGIHQAHTPIFALSTDCLTSAWANASTILCPTMSA